MSEQMIYVFRARRTSFGPLRADLAARFGEPCRLLRTRKGKAAIMFADGEVVFTSLNYIRKRIDAQKT